ncbi:Hypothetical predicted protein [Argonauta hians]
MWRQGGLFIVVVCLVALVQSFDLKDFCKKRCAIGKGGNVCRCNAFHFAGKRSGDLYKRQELDNIDTDNNYESFQNYLRHLRRPSDQLNEYDDNDITTGNQMVYPMSNEALFRRVIAEQMDSDDQIVRDDIQTSNTRNQKEGSRLQNLLQKQYKRYNNNSNNSNTLSGVLPVDVSDFNDRSSRLRNTLHHNGK